MIREIWSLAREKIANALQSDSPTQRGMSVPLIGLGLYSASEAARIATYATNAKLASDTVRRWVKGYSFRRGDKRNFSDRIISPLIALDDAYVLSFTELVELLYIAAFKLEGLSMRFIRRIHEFAKRELRSEHPFATRRFYTDGKNILWELGRRDADIPEGKDHLIEDICHRHIVLEEVVKPFFRKLDYINDIASAFWPLGKDRAVLINPSISFGRAIEYSSGVPTEALYSAHKAGDNLEMVADWFEVPLSGVRDAIEYESGLRKPFVKAA